MMRKMPSKPRRSEMIVNPIIYLIIPKCQSKQQQIQRKIEVGNKRILSIRVRQVIFMQIYFLTRVLALG